MDDDTEAPTVRVTSPADGTRFDSGPEGTVELVIDVEAADVGSGIREVQLLVDGMALGAADTSPPYQYGLNLGSGAYQLSAIAVDNADNSTESTVVNIGVDAEPPSNAGEGGDEDGGEGGGDDGGGGSGDGGLDGGEDGDDGGGLDRDPALPPGFGQDDLTGCACRARSDSAPSAAWLAVMALFALRRRKVRKISGV